MKIKIKVEQPAIIHEVEVTLPAFRKRGAWFYAVLSDTEAIQVFKSEFASVGGYITTGERIAQEAFINTEECTYHEFIEQLNVAIAEMTSIARQLKTSSIEEVIL